LHGRIKVGPVGKGDVGEGEYLEIQAAIVDEANLLGSEVGGVEN
jgi:hypothetical protein